MRVEDLSLFKAQIISKLWEGLRGVAGPESDTGLCALLPVTGCGPVAPNAISSRVKYRQ